MINCFRYGTVVLTSLVFVLCGCSHAPSNTIPPVSIVGTWALTTQRDHNVSNGTVIGDSTFQLPAGRSVTFNSNGTFTNGGFFSSSGTYSLSGSLLTIIDSVGSKIYPVDTLNAHRLAVSANDTLNYNPPVLVDQVTYGFSR